MKIAIHNKIGFSSRWITYCEQHHIPFKIVNCYDSNIIEQLNDCNALMWHYSHFDYKDVLAAKPILFSLEQAGIKVFPDFNTAWHFDNKVAQKYLLEAIDAPLVPSHVFYDKTSALKWANETSYPKVFKLKGGAGSANVSLVNNKREATKKINKAFGRGFSQFNRIGYLKERFTKMRNEKDNLLGVFKALGRLFIPIEYAKMGGREKGYTYFQDFIPNNDSDLRVIVIRNKAFAIQRMVRTGDFRASGSGNIIYLNDEQIDQNILKIAFQTSSKLNAQCLAFDFVYDDTNNPLIVEISYGFAVMAYDLCPGFWCEDLKWHEGKFNPQEWIIQQVVKEINI